MQERRGRWRGWKWTERAEERERQGRTEKVTDGGERG